MCKNILTIWIYILFYNQYNKLRYKLYNIYVGARSLNVWISKFEYINF